MVTSSYWKKYPPDPGDEWVGRFVKNAFDTNEIVQLLVRDWRHFDWLSDQGVDMNKWTKDADLERHRSEYRMSLSGELQASLRHDEKRRYLAGKNVPLFIEPDGYDGIIEPEDIPERLDTDNDWFDQDLRLSDGRDIRISMQGKYWRYFNWLVEKGGNLEGTILSAEQQIKDGRLDMSLSQGLMNGLRRHERDHYLNGNRVWEYKVPLFISPNGYLDIDLRRDRNLGIPRDIINAMGEPETLKMPKQYWQHFDWLAQQGIDMKKWVVKADLARHKSENISYPLRSQLMISLRDDEKRRFQADEPCMLFINPDGYKL